MYPKKDENVVVGARFLGHLPPRWRVGIALEIDPRFMPKILFVPILFAPILFPDLP